MTQTNWKEEPILVTYATRAGSTRGVAEAIAEALAAGGARVEAAAMQDVKDLAPYRAVVAGSAVHGNRWLPEAMRFVEARRGELARKPFAAFAVGMTLAMRGGENYRAHAAEALAPVRALARPVSEGVFAGALDIRRIPNWGDRLKFQLSVWFGVWSEGDHRDWGAIRAWAEAVRSQIGG